jgi:hypothetical protein
MNDIKLEELKAISGNIAKTEELIAFINKVHGCKVHRVIDVRWDSVQLDITLDFRRDTV